MSPPPKIIKHTLRLVPFKNTFRKLIFNHIYKKNLWEGNESISGKGSSLQETDKLRNAFPNIIKQYKITSIADAPCGDFYWMQLLDLKKIKYTGYDIVKEIIAEDIKKYKAKNIDFKVLDIVSEKIAAHDLVLCRDCMVHLGNKHVLKVIKNFKESGSKYLLATTFPNINENEDIPDGMWRRINLEKAPFNLPKPLLLLNEGSKEDKNKSIGLWDLRKIKV
jgi:hypothetical protein